MKTTFAKRVLFTFALALLCAFALAFGLYARAPHVAYAAETDHAGHESWTPVTADGGSLADGNYFLADDVVLTTDLTVSGEVTLCLNGHVLTGTGTRSVITVSQNAELTLCDCNTSAENAVNGTIFEGGVVTGGNDYRGGGISVDKAAKLVMTGGTVAYNEANFGGGIAIAGNNVYGSTFVMEGGEISHNEATDMYGAGGGLFVTYGSFTMNGGRICENKASGDYGVGGGLEGDFSTCELYGGVISDNSAADGGGVYFAGPYGEKNTGYTLTVGGTVSIANNKALAGAGIEVWYATFAMEGGEVSDNYADYYGGGVYSRDCKVTIADGKIAENESGNIGGGLYLYTCVLDATGGEIAGNKSYQGAGMYFGGDWEYDDNDYTFTFGGDALLKGNTADAEGGGMYVDYAKLVMNGGVIEENSSQEGGGVYIVNTCTMTMTGGEIRNNEATKGGGGVYTVDCDVAISGGKISANSARSGGGLYVQSNSLTMSGGEVVGNKAQEDYYGGGIYANISEVRLSGNPVVTDNTAGTQKNNLEINRTTGNTIQIVGSLVAGAKIGVIDQQSRNKTKLTEGFAVYNSGESPASYFFADAERKVVDVDADGEGLLIDDSYTVIYVNGDAQTSVTYYVGEDVALQTAEAVGITVAEGNLFGWTLHMGGTSVVYEGGSVVAGGLSATHGVTVYLYPVQERDLASDLEGAVSDLENSYSEAVEKAENDLKTEISRLEGLISSSDSANLEALTNQIKALSQAYQAADALVTDNVNGLSETLNEARTALQAAIDRLAADLEAAKADLETVKADLQAAAEADKAELEEKLAELEAAYQTADDALHATIEQLRTDLANTEAELQAQIDRNAVILWIAVAAVVVSLGVGIAGLTIALKKRQG